MSAGFCVSGGGGSPRKQGLVVVWGEVGHAHWGVCGDGRQGMTGSMAGPRLPQTSLRGGCFSGAAAGGPGCSPPSPIFLWGVKKCQKMTSHPYFWS